MRWEESVLSMFDDLEMQADGLHLAERAVEVEELSVAQYAEVELGGRLHGSLGRPVHVRLEDGPELRGRLARVGLDWLLLEDDAAAWVVHLPAVVALTGLGPGSRPADALPVSARLTLRSVLRRLAAERQPCAVHLRGGRSLSGTLVRVGADFVELASDETGGPVTVPLAAVSVVQERS